MGIGRYCTVLGIGAAAGAAVALLFAPEKGEKTRRKIGRGFRDAGDNIRDFSEEFGNQANRACKSAREALEDATAKMTRCVTDLAEKARKLA